MSINRNLITVLWISVFLIGLSFTKTLKRGRHPELIDFCLRDEVYVGIPWNCHGYIHCQNANGLKMPFWMDCPANLYFNYDSKTCTWPKNVNQPCPYVGDVVMSFCPEYPNAQVLHPDSCAQYYDCSNRYQLPNRPPYLSECPYPKLFNAETLRCDDFTAVDCGTRKEPLSPCDYVRHQCNGEPGCTPCTDLIPGCAGVPDGRNAYQGRLLTKFYLICRANKTKQIEICPTGVFDPVQGICTKDVDPRAVDILCTTNPRARMEHPGHCARYFDCRSRETGEVIKECPYPRLYSPTKQACVDFEEVDCTGKLEPKSPCEYLEYQCKGKNCPICEIENPSCEGLPNGKNAYLGREETAWYIECRNDRLMDKRSCPGNAIFDPVNRMCPGENIQGPIFEDKVPIDPTTIDATGRLITPPTDSIMLPPPVITVTPPSARQPGLPTDPTILRPDLSPDYGLLNDICRGNEGRIIPDLTNCGRYYNCSRYALQYKDLALNQDECTYPQLFSEERGYCMDFSNVSCGSRYIPKAPCEYVSTQNNCQGPMCDLPCEERSPSCVGMRNGNNTFVGRELSPFYISCYMERTLSVGICRYGVFDPTLRYCTTELDPYSVEVFCTERPTKVFPHIANCARYYDCRAKEVDPALGRYIRECPYPDLFNIESLRCVSRANAKCRWRYEPKDPSDPVQFCLENPTAIMAHPENCARFIDCNKRDSMIGPFQQECKYPDLFDSYNNSCKSYRQVMCGTRPEPKAPCDYQLNLICKDLLGNCPPCEINNPSCIGKRDGPQTVDGRPNFFLECQDERTKNLTQCPAASNFNPVLGSCTMGLDPSNPGPYCKDNPSVVTPHPDNCAQYIDCRQKNTPIGNYIQECPFPLLVSTTDTNSATPCQSFDTVQCGSRREIINPCDYQLNNEPCYEANPSKCVPCSVRYPSCEGKTDGKHAHPTEPTKYLICKSQRTLRVMTCPKGTFRERSGKCVDRFNRRDPTPYCQANPTERFVDPDNCARFFDCSLPDSKYGPYVDECEYPKLFSRKYKRCRPFTKVSCGKRTIPIDACEYLQNQNCKPGELTCEPCTERIPSCIGLPNGNNSFPGREGQPIYITCFRDRTIFVRMCDRGVFDPVQRACVTVEDLNPENPKPYCDAFPTAKIAHPDNCAQYFDCSNPEGAFGAYQFECKYPSLFNTELGDCSIYNSVTCGTRFEPKEPCDYVKNQCPAKAGVNCEPCRDRLPSCVGRQNGNNTFPGRYLSSDFIICWDDRTISVEQCPEGYFDPARGRCRTDIGASDIRAFCDQNPGVIKENPVNCAQYFDCGEESIKAKTFLRECPYPMLFNDKSSTCQNFSYVTCGKRREYVAPCDYLQNRCNPAIRDCVPCPERHPSCVGLPDGFSAVPNQPMSDEYIICDKERTISSSERCASGFFDPKRRRCLREVTEDMISRYCRRNPRSIRAHPFQCAQYYDCRRAIQGSHLRECKYPQLFDVDTLSCRNFTNVDCQNRFIPQAPCDYLQNHCPPNVSNCMPCEDRLPSCINLPDRNNQYPGQKISEYYIKCFRNRTVSVEACQVSMYDPITRECSANVEPTILEKYCKENPSQIIPDPANCGRYYNCSDKTIVRGLEKSYLRECTYPKLFASPALGCQLFMMVNCHGRLQTPMKPCDYVENQCANGTCDPLACEAKFPHCLEKQDGSNIFPGRENTEFYTVCYRQRTVAIVSCTVGIYSHKDRACVGEPPYPQLPP